MIWLPSASGGGPVAFVGFELPQLPAAARPGFGDGKRSTWSSNVSGSEFVPGQFERHT
jgi:hypothetical protein